MQDDESKIDLSQLNREPRSPKTSLFANFKNKTKASYAGRDNLGQFTAGTGGINSVKGPKLSRILPLILVVSLVGGYFVFKSFAATPSATYDLKAYYPNETVATSQYLEGNNYISGVPNQTVLWFEKQDQYTFKMYNAAPQNADRRCNYDVLSWWNDNTLRYSETYNNCGDYPENKVVYDSPIIFLPRTWDSAKPWELTQTTSAKYYEKSSGAPASLQLRCTGTTVYTAKIIGIENLTQKPIEPAIHWQTTQTTTWNTGLVPGRCAAGYKTRWQEDYWLVDSLKTQTATNTTAKAVRRTKGGNLDSPSSGWDAWYDNWNPLPKAIPADGSAIEGVPATPTKPFSKTPVGL